MHSFEGLKEYMSVTASGLNVEYFMSGSTLNSAGSCSGFSSSGTRFTPYDGSSDEDACA